MEKFLVIGNSITLHHKSSYWNSEHGMAATSQDKDFVHLLASNLEMEPVYLHFSDFEVLAHDREQLLHLLDKYLDDKYSFVVVQLGDNVADSTTWEEDYKALLAKLRTEIGTTCLITVGNFWENKKVDTQLFHASMEYMATFIPLIDIHKQSKYQAGLNFTVTNLEGEEMIVKHNGVALHPGNTGMKVIATKIEFAYLEYALRNS